MKMTMKLFSICICGAALSGCVSPGQSSKGFQSFQWVDPEPDGYYTGEQPDFANRFNPNPKGRKFRVAYLRFHMESIEGVEGGAAIKSAVEKSMYAIFEPYMAFREQAKASHPANYLQNDIKLGDSFRASVKNHFAYERTNIKVYLASADVVAAGGSDKLGGILGEPTPYEFAQHWEDMDYLNAELTSRYPRLFTTDESGFPLDIVMIGLYRMGNPVVRMRFESWCVGLPEHANIDWRQRVFKPSEAFLDPYDAIAAALFKLTDKQFEGLEPANPNDHNWLEEK